MRFWPKRPRLILSLALAALVFVPTAALASPLSGNLYVSLQGSDATGDGSTGSPWRTIQKAVNVLQAEGVSSSVVVNVTPGAAASGTFVESVTIPSIPGASATNTITIQAAAGKLVKVENATANAPAFKLNGCAYVFVKGFDVSTPATGTGVLFSGSSTQNCVASGLNIHDVTGSGKAAVRFENGATGNRVENSILTGKTYGVWTESSDGNTIQNCFVYGSTDNGIYVDKSADTKVYYNSVRSIAGAPSNLIRFSPATGDTGCEFKDNNLYLESTGTSQTAFYVSSTSAAWTGNYQNIYIVGTGRTGYYSGTGYTSLAAWKAAGHGQDANSIAVEPREISAKNQRICQGIGQGTNPLVGQGVAISGITTDIGGATRSSPPTIGAHETPLAPLEGAIGLVALDGSGNWTSIQDAADELVARGVSGAVTVSVAPGTYSGQVRVKAIPGASATNTVTFEKTSGTAALIDATGADYGIYFDSASHVTFKGIDVRNSGKEGVLFGGTSTSSRIVSSEVKSVGLSASVPSVKFESGTIGCKVQKCEVLGDTEGILVASATDAEISNSWIRGGANYGLHLQTCNGAKVYFNSFRDMAPGTPDQLVRIDGGSTTSANILKNNIFQVDSTASDYCIYVVNNGNAFVSDYNDFWIPNGAKAGYWNGSARATLLDWRGAGHGEDAHSLSGDPVYVSIYDLHVGQGSAVLGRGTGIAGITEDMEGTPRPPIPSMGSDEEPLPPVSGTLTIKQDGMGNYRNFVECAEMLRVQTVTGPVTVLADPGTYMEERTVPVNAIPGASASNPIVIKPASGTVVVKNAANQDVFTFDGASNIALESLEITGASDGHGVYMKNGSTANILKKLYVHDLQGSKAGIFLDTGTTANVVTQCKIFGAKYALELQSADGNVLTNNMLRGGTDQTVLVNQSAGTQFLHNTLRSETTGKPDRLLQFNPGTGDTGNVFKNNIFALVSATSTNRCFHVQSASVAFVADNNDYYIENVGQVGYYNGSARVTLSDWKNAGHGQDANSVSDNPSLVSSTDLHLQSGSSLLGKGIAISSVAVDFDGDARSPFKPDIGADEMTITNQAPIANAGADQSVKVSTQVNLNGSASSDPDSQPFALGYSWAQVSGPGISLTNPTTATPSFTPTKVGTYTIRLTVNDGKASASDDVLVLISKETASMPANDIVAGPGETYETIQAAVDAATAGQVVGIKDKTGGYKESVVINKTLTLQRVTGNNPVLDGEGTRDTGFDIQAANVVIDGFEIKGFKERGVSGNSSATGATLQNLVIHDIAGGTAPAAIGGIKATVKDCDIGTAGVGLLDTDNLTLQDSNIHDQTVSALKDVDSATLTNVLIENVPKGFTGTNTSITVSSSTLQNVSSIGFEGVAGLTLNQSTLLDNVATGVKTCTTVLADGITVKNSSAAGFDGIASLSLKNSEMRSNAVGVKGGTAVAIERVLFEGSTTAAIQSAAGTFTFVTLTKNAIAFDATSGTANSCIVWGNVLPFRGTGASALTLKYSIAQNWSGSAAQNPNISNGGHVLQLNPKFTDEAAGDYSLFVDVATPGNSSPAINTADPTLPVPENGGTVADMGYLESDLTDVEESQLPDPYEAETPSGTVTISIPQDEQSRRFIGKPEGLGAQIFSSLAGEDITVTAPGTTPMSIKLTQEKPLLTSASRGLFYFGTTGTDTTVTMTTSGGTPNQFVVHARGVTPSMFVDDLMVRARNPSTNALLGEVPVTVLALTLDNGAAGFRGRMFTANDGEVVRTVSTVPPVDQMGIIFPTVAAGTDDVPGIEAEMKKAPLFNGKTPGEIETSPLKTDATGKLVVQNSAGISAGPSISFPFTPLGGANPSPHCDCENTVNAKDSGGGLGPTRKEGKYKNCAGAAQGPDNPESVEMWDGEEVRRVSIFSLSGRGIDFDLTAKYRSKAANLRPFRLSDFGNEWTIDYIDERLVQDGNHIIRMSSRGRGDIYRTLADQGSPGSFKSPMEFFTKIRILPDTSDIVIRDFDGEQKTYKAFTDANIPGRLIRQEDRNGNFLTFGYAQVDPDDQVTGDEKYVLTVVTDSMGRDIRFRYFASAVQGTGFEAKTVEDATGEKYGLLAEVSDFRREVNDPDEPRTNATPTGRTVKFDYYISSDTAGNAGDLKSITSPTVENTPNGNDFANGKKTVFTYKVITDAQIATNPKMKRLKSNLLTITAPNEVAASGPAKTVIEYYEEPANETTFDRVKKYSLGGTNASGVKAGGDIEYTYTELAPNLDAPTSVVMNLPKLQIGVTDRNGNSTQYKYSGYGPILEKKETTRGLRSSDPQFYLQTYAFSEDKQPLHVANAEGGFTDYEYDSTSSDRHQQGNVLRTTATADSRGGDQATIVNCGVCGGGKPAYEPIFGQTRRIIDPRGVDEDYIPSIADPVTRTKIARYTTAFYFDYQEDDQTEEVEGQSFYKSAVRLTKIRGLDETLKANVLSTCVMLNDNNVKLGLGDLNGDGVKTEQTHGNVIRVVYPSIVLDDSGTQPMNQIAIEEILDSGDLIDQSKGPIDGGPGEGSDPAIAKKMQTRAVFYRYNDFGQMTSMVDEELNVHAYQYNPENDPDGDGLLTGATNAPPGPADGRSLGGSGGGYLKKTIRDASSDPDAGGLNAKRDNSTNPAAVALSSEFTYDDVGNTIAVLSGRGVRTDFFVNELDQTLEVTRAAATPGTYTPGNPLSLEPFAYKSRTFFDYNDNVVFSQMEERGNTSSVDGNLASGDIPSIVSDPDPTGGIAWLDSSFKYDILDNRVETVQEVTNGSSLKVLRSKARYDRNENLVVSVAPEGTAVFTRYDDRDMPFSRTRGFTGTLSEGFSAGQLPTGESFTVADVRGGIASTTYSHYNKNGSLIETVDAEDSDSSTANNSTIAGEGDRTRYIYDGFDRLTSVVDSCGNQVVYQFDPAGNRIRVLHFGPNGGASPTSDGQIASPVSISVNGVPTVQVNNLVNQNLLAASEFKFDEAGKMYQSDRVLFVAAGLDPERTPDVDDNDASISTLYPSDNQSIPGITTVTILGRVTSRSEFDRKSRSTFGVEDDLDTYRTDYDGADRTVKSTDPEQNLVEYAFDEDSNAIETKETDHAQRTGVSDQIFHSTSFHDSLGRLILAVDSLGQADDYRYDSRGNMVAHADAQGPGTRSINRRGLGATGEVTINNFGNVSRFFFDGIGRQKKSEQYMTASGEGDGEHVGATTEGIKDKSGSDESYPPAVDTNQAGGDGIIRVGYVWDDNSLLHALLDDQGNVTCYLYENLNRRVVETKGLTTNDVDNKFVRTNILGSASPGPRVVFTPTVQTLGSPAVIPDGKIDDQLTELRAGVNAVKAEFSALADRKDELPPTSIIYGYGLDDEVLILEDENDSEIYSRFDAIGRRIATRVFRAGQSDSFTGDSIFAPSNMSPDVRNPAQYDQSTDPVVGTTKVDSEFDGLGRLTKAKDNNEPGDAGDDSEMSLFYDSLSHLFEEGQKLGSGDVRVVSSSWRADDQRDAVTYPTSGTTARKVLHTFDGLDRLKTVKDDGAGTPIANYIYIGKWRVDRREMQNGVNLEVAYDSGRRVTEYKHAKNGNTVVGFGHTYNRTNNKLIQESLHDSRASERYSYDSAYRLGKPGEGNGFERGTLNSGKTAIETPTTIPGAEQKSDYNLDGVGNWKSEVFTFQGGSETTDNRSHTSINELYSSNIGGTAKDITHDDSGNVLDDDTKAHAHIDKPRVKHKWDYRNLLREVVSKETGTPRLGKYTYDALLRRVRKIAGEGENAVSTFYLLDGNREVQERNASGTILQEYTFGIYIDEPLTLDKNGNADDTCIGTGDTRYFYQQNTLYSVYALTDADGGIKEAYFYDPYGRPYVITDGDDQDSVVNFSSNDAVAKGGNSALGNSFLFTGRRSDEEVYGQYYYRARYNDYECGLFLSRDPVSLRDMDIPSYLYVGKRPTFYIDPFGTQIVRPHLAGPPSKPKAGIPSYQFEVDFSTFPVIGPSSRGFMGIVEHDVLIQNVFSFSFGIRKNLTPYSGMLIYSEYFRMVAGKAPPGLNTDTHSMEMPGEWCYFYEVRDNYIGVGFVLFGNGGFPWGNYLLFPPAFSFNTRFPPGFIRASGIGFTTGPITHWGSSYHYVNLACLSRLCEPFLPFLKVPKDVREYLRIWGVLSKGKTVHVFTEKELKPLPRRGDDDDDDDE